MQTFLGLFICFLLIAAGTALECEVCKSHGTNCTGSLQTCESGKDTCIIMRKVDTQFGSRIESIDKRCAPSSVCDGEPIYRSYGQGKGLRAIFTCCVGEACRKATLQFPPDKPNGKRCPACYVTSSIGWCREGEMVDCVGPENHCMDLRRKHTHGTNTIVEKGCVSKSICDYLKFYEAIEPWFKIIKAECTPAPTTSP